MKAYCSKILCPTFPEWITPEEYGGFSLLHDDNYIHRKEDMLKYLEKSEEEYLVRQEKYDRFIADWMPRLPPENGEGKEITRLLQRLQKETNQKGAKP